MSISLLLLVLHLVFYGHFVAGEPDKHLRRRPFLRRALSSRLQHMNICPDKRLSCPDGAICILQQSRNIFRQATSRYACSSLNTSSFDGENLDASNSSVTVNAERGANATVLDQPLTVESDDFIAQTRANIVAEELVRNDSSKAPQNSNAQDDEQTQVSSTSKTAIYILVVSATLVFVEVLWLRRVERVVKKDRLTVNDDDPFGLPPLRPSTAIDLTLAKAEAQVALGTDDETEQSEI